MDSRARVGSQATALVFNAAVAASCVAAASALGVFDALKQHGSLDIDEFCDTHGVHPPSLSYLLKILESFDVVNILPNQSRVQCGDAFSDFCGERGLFEWLFHGTGTLLTNLSDHVRVANRPADPANTNFLNRDGSRVARASSGCASFVDPYFEDLIRPVSVAKILDLGCGTGTRLIDLVSKKDCFGVGLDISPQAVDEARRSVRERGLENRITIIQGDVAKLEALPVLADVDLITMCFMGHDLWPSTNCARTFRRLRMFSPSCRRFLMCDTVRSEVQLSTHMPAFTTAFEMAHSVMGKSLPTLDEWCEVFLTSEWKCSGYHRIGIPFSYIFDLTPNPQGYDRVHHDTPGSSQVLD